MGKVWRTVGVREVSLKLKGKGVSEMCEECNGIWE